MSALVSEVSRARVRARRDLGVAVPQDVEAQRIDGRDQHPDPHVELAAAHERRPVHVALEGHVLASIALGATARGRPPAVPVDDPVQDPGIERGRRRHVAPRHRNDVHAARQVAALARLDDPDDGKRLARGPRDDVRRARHRHADVARRPSPGRRGHVEGGQERGAEPGVGARRHVAATRPERVRRAAFRRDARDAGDVAEAGVRCEARGATAGRACRRARRVIPGAWLPDVHVERRAARRAVKRACASSNKSKAP